jgi:hypothetical protein
MESAMSRRGFQEGDWVVYRRLKFTRHPGRRAHDVTASPHGDDYSYLVDKFWIVVNVLSDGKLTLRTRRGKTHVVEPNDPNLRHATLWDRIRYRQRFLELKGSTPPGNG